MREREREREKAKNRLITFRNSVFTKCLVKKKERFTLPQYQA